MVDFNHQFSYKQSFVEYVDYYSPVLNKIRSTVIFSPFLFIIYFGVIGLKFCYSVVTKIVRKAMNKSSLL